MALQGDQGGGTGQPQDDWSLWRTDDNGNSFLVKGRLTQDEAEQLLREYTAKGHKQVYWLHEQNLIDYSRPNTI